MNSLTCIQLEAVCHVIKPCLDLRDHGCALSAADLEANGVIVKWLKNDNGMTVEVPVINGRVDKEAYMEGNILDGPRGGPPVYGLEGCRNFKKNNPGQSIWIADCQSLLALALSLQFPHEWQDFTWVTGSVNMGYKDNWPNYSPSHANQPRWNNGRWVPPARRDLDMLRDTTKKVNVFKKHVVGCPDGVDDGCKTFVA
jgi:hypothetical protein